ncbi:MAG: hypothetical protein OXH07_08470 [Chloroflexi bacterium]|nr:hypothetical protein [Chloroflexota bacterium]
MKKNFISAIAGWKSAALLALVAMVAAVAFSGVLTSTQTADAQTDDSSDKSTAPGGTVQLLFTSASDTNDRFVIASTSTGTATFSANGSTSIRCRDNSNASPSTPGCDTNGADSGVQLSVKVDEDSPLGEIYVQVGTFNRTTGEFDVAGTVIITVAAPDPPTAIQLVGLPPASINMDGSAPRHISVRVVKANGSMVGGVSLNVITTGGALETDGSGNCQADDSGAGTADQLDNGRAFCTVSTVVDADTNTDGNQPGPAKISLFGTGVPGSAKVTFSVAQPALTLETSVVLHGPVDSITADAEQSSIQIGGSTFIVVTISDAAGNPIPNETAAVTTNVFGGQVITAPETPQSVAAVKVVSAADVNKERNPRTVTAALGDIPSCAIHDAVAQVLEADATETNPATEGQAASTGTDSKGRCVIQIRAPQGPPLGGDPASATRGTHTVSVRADDLAAKPDPKAVVVEIHVGGAPASIETDAPASVDSLSSTTITVTVLDDEGVRVGSVGYSIDQIEGEGKITSGETDADSRTADGQAKFTYRAPREGTALFLITVPVGPSEISHTIEVAIGAAPEAPSATWNNDLVSGQNLVVWNGADGADPSDGAADGVTAIWSYNTGSGSWDGYFPSAADVPGGNTLTSLSNGQAYVVIVE